jgi:hypothetical protein
MLRQFIPARLEDNPTMEETSPNYRQTLMGSGTADLVRALLEGDWDVVAGASFEKLSRDPEKGHMLRPLVPPSHWYRFMAMDWGSTKPFSIGW